MIRKAPHSRISIAGATILALVGLALPFILVPFGFWPSDEPYQVMLTENCQANPVAFFSSFLFGLWGKVFGFGLITMRSFAAILSTTTVVIAGCVHFFYTHNAVKSIVVSAVANIFLTFHQSQSYTVGWDVVSNLFLVASLAMLLVISRTDKPRCLAYSAILGVFSAMAVVSRLPNAVMPPLVILLFLFRHKWKELLIFAFICALTTIAIITAIYGGVAQYVTSLSDYFAVQIADEHQHSILLAAFLIGMRRILPLAVAVIALSAIARFAEKRNSDYVMWAAIAIIPAVMGYYFFHAFNSDNQHLSDIFTIGVATLIIVWHDSSVGNCWKRLWTVSALLTFMILPNVGSNAFWSKYLAVQILPIALIPLTVAPSKAAKWWTVCLGGSLIILLSIAKTTKNTWLDEGVAYCDHRFSLSRLEGIYTSHTRGKEIESIAKLAQEGCVIVGDGWQTFDYIGVSPRINERLINYFGVINGTLLNSSEYVNLFIDTIRQHRHKIVVIDLLLQSFHTPSSQTIMAKLLMDNGYTPISIGRAHTIYEPTQQQIGD